MTVKEFLDDYKKTKSIDKHIVKKYLPYAEKISFCTNIVESTCYEILSDGKKIFKVNSPFRNALFLLNLVEHYTDISIDWKQGALSEFDALSESETLALIIKTIPESEVKQCSSILEMCLDDLMTNTRDLVSYVESKSQAVGLMLNTVYDMLINSDEGKTIINSLGIGEVLSK